MAIVATDLRQTRPAAREIRFTPIPGINATNVQGAIQQALGIPNPTSINSGMSPYNVQTTDGTLLVNTSAGPVTINMMPEALRGGIQLEIKDDTGNAATNPISVVMNGAEKADGLSTFIIDSNYGRALFIPQVGGYWVK